MNVLAPLLPNLSVICRIGLPFTGVHRLTVWPPRYRLMHQRCGAICSVVALSSHVPCMQLSLETLALVGLGFPLGILACVAPKCTIHTTCMDPSSLGSFWYLGVNSYYLWGPTYVACDYCQTTDVRCLSLVSRFNVDL